MNTYEICCNIRKKILNVTAEVMNYTNWDSEFAHKQIKELNTNIKKQIKLIDPHVLTIDEMKELGFIRWSDDNKMMLIPLWLFQFIDPEIEVECISGEIVKFKDADNDNRYGCLAYGVVPKLQ